jgi:IS5 family transposase
MFKMTLLQHFYDLSDPECEAQVADRRSFREFGGLGLADRVPDETAAGSHTAWMGTGGRCPAYRRATRRSSWGDDAGKGQIA